jgi:hypothetical protein
VSGPGCFRGDPVDWCGWGLAGSPDASERSRRWLPACSTTQATRSTLYGQPWRERVPSFARDATGARRRHARATLNRAQPVTHTGDTEPSPAASPAVTKAGPASKSGRCLLLAKARRAGGRGSLAYVPVPLLLEGRHIRRRAPARPAGARAGARPRRRVDGRVAHRAPRRARPVPAADDHAGRFAARPLSHAALQARRHARLERRADRRAAGAWRRRLDRLQGRYRGTAVDNPTDPGLYRRAAEAFPDAWLEDRDLGTEEARAALAGHEARITWDAPIHDVQDTSTRRWCRAR